MRRRPPPAFAFPTPVWERPLRTLGRAERALRALLRHPAARRRWPGLEDLGRLAPQRPRARDAPSPPLPGLQPPVVYLPALPWSYRFQRPQQLAGALAAAGHPVLYVDGFQRTWLQPRHSLRVTGSGVSVLEMRLPGRPDLYRGYLSEPAAERAAATLAAGLRRRPCLLLAQLPAWAPLAAALRRRIGAPLIYDRIDLHAGFPGATEQVAGDEARLFADADLVTASSRGLAAGSEAAKGPVHLLRNGVDLGDFTLAPCRRGDAVRAGLVGSLDFRIDADALARTARALPSWRFELAGEVAAPAVQGLAELPNVELHGEIPYRRLPDFLSRLDLGLIPYRDLPLTRCIDPVKLYEMLAVGLPVVAHRLPELERLAEPFIYLYQTHEELAVQLRRAHAEDSEELRRRRRRIAADNTWQARARTLLAAVSALSGENSPPPRPPGG